MTFDRPSVESRHRRAGRVPPLAALFLLAATLSCGREQEPAPTRVVHDLVESFQQAEWHSPTTLIDFGRPEDRRFLVSGWFDGSRRLDEPGESVATWSMGEAAEIEFFVALPATTEVTLRCAPMVQNVREPWTLGLRINGTDWRSLDLERHLREYRLELPASLLRQGQNRLQVVHPELAEPSAAAVKADVRVLWDYLKLGTGSPEPGPRPFARDDKDVLFLPFGVRVDFYLELPEHSVLAAANSRGRGDATGRLRVTWEELDGEEEVLAEDFSALPSFVLPLSRASGRKGRLSLFALSSSGGPAFDAAGMLLAEPQIRAGGPAPDAAGERPRSARRTASPTAPNIVVYLVDTLRADHLGCYGYPKDTSPNIDRFAQDGFLFENAQAQSPWTRASVASIFTGLWPQVHGANDDPDTLSENAQTLAESLKELGYQTAAITANGNAHGPWGFAQGFDYFKYLSHVRPGDPLATSADVNETAFAWLAQYSEQQPFFLYLHPADPHAPYSPPPSHRAKLAGFVEDLEIGTVEAVAELNNRRSVSAEHIEKLEALYDAEIAANDESFGLLLDELEKRGLYEGSLIIFLSDHGEEFYDHQGWAHGKTLHAEMLDVPLIVKMPHSRGPRRIRRIAQHVDIYPTLMELVTGSVPEGIQGRSLLPLLVPEPSGPAAPPPAWPDWSVAHVDLRGTTATSLIDGSWKVIQRHDSQHDAYPELYSRDQDRLEQKNLAPERPTLAKLLAAALRSQQASLGEGLEAPAIDAEELAKVAEELRALGYLE